jgi:glycosyltransferase involved in cell wall biosynthesis
MKVGVLVVAYNAESTLRWVLDRIPPELRTDLVEVLVMDDHSADGTFEVAHEYIADGTDIPLTIIRHDHNLGYGGNQKAGYRYAIDHGWDVVVMLHPDYQYDATRIPDLIAPILSGEKHLMLGSRFLGDPLAGGMPKWKYVANRFLTTVENLVFGLHLSEYHTGLRAYSRRLLETIPYELNSNDFVFDQELIAQVVAAGMGRRIGEIAVPTRYFDEASSVGFQRSVVYGLATLRVVLRFMLHRVGVRRSPKLTARPSGPRRPAG